MSLFDKGAAIEAKACELILDAPEGYSVIGGPYANLGPRFGIYDDVPTRGKIEPVINDVVAAIKPLSVTGTDHVGRTQVEITPSQAFPKLNLVENDIDNWTGLAATAYHDNYELFMPIVPQAQFIAGTVLVHALEAEIDLWERVVRDANDIADKTLAALEDADGKGDASFAFGLTVLAALATVGVTIVTGGGAAAIALTVAAGGASSGAAAIPLSHSSPDPEGVMTAMYSALETLDTETQRKEQQIADGVTKMQGIVESDLVKNSWSEIDYPVFKFKPTPLEQGTGHLGTYTPGP